jgi:hypothetical protein
MSQPLFTPRRPLMWRPLFKRATKWATAASLVIAGSLASPSIATAETPDTSIADLDEDAHVTASDFGCLQDWPVVGHTRYANVNGHLDEALAVARNPDGGVFPIGTIVQLMPTEAMVKRATSTYPETDDWEFIKLTLKKGQVLISERGGGEMKNIGGNCVECHTPDKGYDRVCSTDHGCKSLPGFVVRAALKAVEKDPRCVKPE